MFEDLPPTLRPDAHLAGVAPEPVEWVTVVSHERTDTHNGGISCYLTPLEDVADALRTDTWDGRSLGEAEVWRVEDTCHFSDGLTSERGPTCHFLCHFRAHHGLQTHSSEFTPTLLWFFDAIPRPDGSWYFVDRAGRDIELIRVIRAGENRRIDMSALPLRRYLAARGLVLVIQRDFVQFTAERLDERLMREFRDEWAVFTYSARSERLHDDLPSFYRIMGKHVVWPLAIDPCEDTDFDRDDPPYPEYVIGVDPATGEHIQWSCREEDLSNYFVDRNAPHYLTPVYFRREVLARYTSQPMKYSVSQHGISCLDLWSLRMDTNEEHLVEVYLGDLGNYLPAEEREYWRSFNVPPTGGMRESRYRADFLGQWRESVEDPVARLFNSRDELGREFERRFGRDLFVTMQPDDRVAWDGLHLMSTEDPTERDSLITILAKGLVDSLDVHALREVVGEEDGKSLALLSSFVEKIGGEPSAVDPLRLVYGLRSTGAAHIRGENYRKALARGGLESLRPSEQFERLISSTAIALEQIVSLLSEFSPPEPPAQALP